MPNHSQIVQRIFEPLTYRGPGSRSSTCRALSALPCLAERPRILDIGCGPGRQTLHLADQTSGHLIAVDLDAGSVAILSERVRHRGLSDRVTAIRSSMTQLCFSDEAFDLIWSEGAIYCMGFASGLAAWKRYLLPGGYLAVTQLTWLTPSPPRTTQRYWEKHYPEMVDVSDNLAAIDRAGYRQICNFALPESDWWDHFYRDLSAELAEYRQRHQGNDGDSLEEQTLIEEFESEMEALRESQGSYSYVFYVMQKPN